MASIDAVLQTIDQNRPAALERLFELLAIPSISTDAAYAPQCERAAEWLARELTGLGFDAKVHATAGRPMVLGHAKAAHRDAPHVLFYGHYDVQPVDPLNLWNTDPFKPELQDGQRIVARGASDDKGQLMTFVEACRAFRETGGLPCEVTVLFEREVGAQRVLVGRLRGGQQGRAARRPRARLRHGHVGRRDAVHHHHAARPRG